MPAKEKGGALPQKARGKGIGKKGKLPSRSSILSRVGREDKGVTKSAGKSAIFLKFSSKNC